MANIRQKIVYRAPTDTATGSGGEKTAFANVTPEDYAWVTNLNEKLEVVALQEVQSALKRFRVDQRPSFVVTNKYLITYKGEDYKINSIEAVKEDYYYYDIVAKAIR